LTDVSVRLSIADTITKSSRFFERQATSSVSAVASAATGSLLVLLPNALLPHVTAGFSG
jgi:hypothetical protein